MKREEAEMEISVFELRLKVYTLVDINLEEVLLRWMTNGLDSTRIMNTRIIHSVDFIP